MRGRRPAPFPCRPHTSDRGPTHPENTSSEKSAVPQNERRRREAPCVAISQETIVVRARHRLEVPCLECCRSFWGLRQRLTALMIHEYHAEKEKTPRRGGKKLTPGEKMIQKEVYERYEAKDSFICRLGAPAEVVPPNSRSADVRRTYDERMRHMFARRGVS